MSPATAIAAAFLTLLAPSHYRLIGHQTYAVQDRGQADVYLPREVHAGAPMVVFFYGGSWDSGDRAFYRFVGASLASSGIVTVIPDYRLYPQARYPQFLQDNALAVRWAREHAQEWGADPSRMVLMGHSAGAYNAVMLGLDSRWLAEVGLDANRDIAGVVGLAGPYDFLPLETDELNAIFGPIEGQPATQPINHVDGHGPPLLLLHGGVDTVVLPRNSTRLAEAVTAAGGNARLIIYPRLGHSEQLGVLLPQRRGGTNAFGDMIAFIRQAATPRRVDQAA